MTRLIRSGPVALVLLACSSAAMTAPPQGSSSNSNKLMLRAARALIQPLGQNMSPPQVSAQIAQARPDNGDGDQGDEHASDRAILVVCNHDNPSAQRSAICPNPNSPP